MPGGVRTNGNDVVPVGASSAARGADAVMIADMPSRTPSAVRPGRRIRARRWILLLAAVPLVAAACSPTPQSPVGDGGHLEVGTSVDRPTTDTLPDPDPDLARYYDQQLDWGDCGPFVTSPDDAAPYASDDVECARVSVPLDYGDPDGQSVTIGALRAPATGERIGSLLFNPGGPGASGMSIVALIAQFGIASELAEHFDLVGFDPRGVGASEPYVTCETDAQRDEGRAENWPGFMPTSTPAQVERANDTSRAFVRSCVDRIGDQGIDGAAFLAQLGTDNVARDLDILRATLGDARLNYVGWSYGTSIGTQYAEQFPDRVRAMILDGAVDPSIDSATDSLQQTAAFQQAFDHFADWCAGRTACPWRSADTATATFQSLAQPLMDYPLPLADGRALSFLDAVTGVANALYSDLSWPRLLTALDNFADGNGTALMALADEYYDRDPSGSYGTLLEAFTAIRCMDSDRITDPDQVRALNEKLQAAAPFQDNGQPAAAVFDTCAFWPAPPTVTPHIPDPDGLAPVLVISTTGDPATPYEAGVRLADYLGGRLLTVDGARHTAYLLSGLGCVDAIGNAYLLDLTLPEDGATCS